jgi:hypothetical protein
MHTNIAFVEFTSTGVLELAARVAATIDDVTCLSTVPPDLANCKVAIVHCSPPAWDSCVRAADPGMILVRVSTVDHVGAPGPLRDDRGIDILHLVPAVQSVSDDEWREIFINLLQYRGPQSLPRHIASMFRREQLPILAALLVLCHGYLVAPADRRASTSTVEWWSCLWEATSGIIDESSFQEWWASVITREWGADPANAKHLSAVQSLVDAIRNEREPIQHELVRSAHAALRERFSKTKQ